jgi:hypothetical protein
MFILKDLSMYCLQGARPEAGLMNCIKLIGCWFIQTGVMLFI